MKTNILVLLLAAFILAACSNESEERFVVADKDVSIKQATDRSIIVSAGEIVIQLRVSNNSTHIEVSQGGHTQFQINYLDNERNPYDVFRYAEIDEKRYMLIYDESGNVENRQEITNSLK